MALSLSKYACNVLVKFINTIEDVGDLEYRILEPVLKKITSPHQLKKLEANSPQIAGEDEELWKKFIARDFGADAVDKWVPKNPKSWSKVYDKHQKEAILAQERAAELLKAEFQSLTSSKESGRTRLVESRSLPPIRRSKPWGSSGGGSSSWGQSSNSWTHQAGAKTKNIIQKARREAKEISFFQRLSTDTRKLGGNTIVSEGMRQRIKSAEEIRSEKDRIAEMSKTAGRASGALGKRKAQEVEEEEEVEEHGEEERRRRAEDFRRKAMEKRAPAVGGPRLKQAPEKKPADPFFRPKQANPLAMPQKRRR